MLLIEGPAFTSTVSFVKPVNFFPPPCISINSTQLPAINSINSITPLDPSLPAASVNSTPPLPPPTGNWFTIKGVPIFTSSSEQPKDQTPEDLDSLTHEAKTAFSVWDCSLVLSKLLESVQTKSKEGERFIAPGVELELKGRRVIELGAGRGIAGLSAALLGARSVITDIHEVIPALQDIVNLNNLLMPCQSAEGGTVEQVTGLDWTNSEETIKDLTKDEPFSVILAADVVWMYDLVGPLVNTIKCLMGPKTITILAHQSRSSRVDDALMSDFEKAGLKVTQVDDNLLDGKRKRGGINTPQDPDATNTDSLLPDPKGPISCPETNLILQSLSHWLNLIGISSALETIQSDLSRTTTTQTHPHPETSSQVQRSTLILNRLDQTTTDSSIRTSRLFDQCSPSTTPTSKTSKAKYTQSQLESVLLSIYLTLRTLECNNSLLYIDSVCRRTLYGDREDVVVGCWTFQSALLPQHKDKEAAEFLFPPLAKFWLTSLRGSDCMTIVPDFKEEGFVDFKPGTTRRKMEWGACGMKGWEVVSPIEQKPIHDHIEDAIYTPRTTLHPYLHSESTHFPLFVLSDGHGGRAASEWFTARVPAAVERAVSVALALNPRNVGKVLEKPEARDAVARSVREALKKLDGEFCELRKGQHLKYAEGKRRESGKGDKSLTTRSVGGTPKKKGGAGGGAMGVEDPFDDGCTLLVVCLLGGGRWLLTAHVGDSRVAAGCIVESFDASLELDEKADSTKKTTAKNVRTPSTSARKVVDTPTSALVSTNLVLVTQDHSADHSRKVAGNLAGGAVWRLSKTHPPIELPQEILSTKCFDDHLGVDPISCPTIPQLKDARIYRHDDFKNSLGIRSKSLGMSDAMGDIIMKLEPPIFQARADVHIVPLDPTKEHVILMASDGVWGSLKNPNDPTQEAQQLVNHCASEIASNVISLSSLASDLDTEPTVARPRRSGRTTTTTTTIKSNTQNGPCFYPSEHLKTQTLSTVVDPGSPHHHHRLLNLLLGSCKTGMLDTPHSPLHKGFGTLAGCVSAAEALAWRHLGPWKRLFRGTDAVVDDAAAVVVWLGAVEGLEAEGGGRDGVVEKTGLGLECGRGGNVNPFVVPDSLDMDVVQEKTQSPTEDPLECLAMESPLRQYTSKNRVTSVAETPSTMLERTHILVPETPRTPTPSSSFSSLDS
ncbi:hypothetical protein HDV05_003323 [Chytridiales sp. JEL 0842]|nr:hypothetical protein HDV05_003323 [Chytridiales sp. JEL 0842]